MTDFKVTEYVTELGDSPFRKWTLGLDKVVRGRIDSRLRRFSQGNFGDNRHLGKGLCEAKLDFGSGYRIYYGIHGQRLVILLCGGDKGSQVRDIQTARRYWDVFLEGTNER